MFMFNTKIPETDQYQRVSSGIFQYLNQPSFINERINHIHETLMASGLKQSTPIRPTIRLYGKHSNLKYAIESEYHLFEQYVISKDMSVMSNVDEFIIGTFTIFIHFLPISIQTQSRKVPDLNKLTFYPYDWKIEIIKKMTRILYHRNFN